MSQQRIAAIRKRLEQENLDGLVVTELNQVRYLCGYTGSNGLLVITPQRAIFLTDFRYADQCHQEVKGARPMVMPKGDLIGCLAQYPQYNRKNITLGFTQGTLSVSGLERLKKVVPAAILVPADSVLEELGWVKDAGEIACITKAVQIAETALGRVLCLVKAGVREREVAAELEYQMAMLGSERPAFPTIIASGYRSAMPHGDASSKKIRKGDFVTFDFGATVGGYVSDITRTVVVGKASARQKKIYKLVLKAQLAGLHKVKAGVPAKAVDEACRRIITKAGYGKEFGHGTGHGIGFPRDPIHTGPHVSSMSTDVLKLHQVITVEPGIYISGWGGVRIEDDVVVTRTGGKVLNKSPKNLLEL